MCCHKHIKSCFFFQLGTTVNTEAQNRSAHTEQLYGFTYD